MKVSTNTNTFIQFYKNLVGIFEINISCIFLEKLLKDKLFMKNNVTNNHTTPNFTKTEQNTVVKGDKVLRANGFFGSRVITKRVTGRDGAECTLTPSPVVNVTNKSMN